MIELSFLIPLYNEERKVLETINTINEAVTQFPIEYEIIVCNDASTDSSLSAINSVNQDNLHVLSNSTNIGFAASYHKCLLRAQGTSSIYISADNDIDVENLKLVLQNYNKAPVVLQYCTNISHRCWYRYAISVIFTKLMNTFTGNRLHYYNGFNIYPTSEVLALNINENSFAFQAEIASQLVKKLSFVEVGINCRFDDGHSSATKLKNILMVIKYLFVKLFSRFKRN